MTADHIEPIGALIARVRARSGISQDRLAERLCAAAGRATLTRNEVSRWERGRRVPGGDWRASLADVLGVPLAHLDLAAHARPPADTVDG